MTKSECKTRGKDDFFHEAQLWERLLVVDFSWRMKRLLNFYKGLKIFVKIEERRKNERQKARWKEEAQRLGFELTKSCTLYMTSCMPNKCSSNTTADKLTATKHTHDWSRVPGIRLQSQVVDWIHNSNQISARRLSDFLPLISVN